MPSRRTEAPPERRIVILKARQWQDIAGSWEITMRTRGAGGKITPAMVGVMKRAVPLMLARIEGVNPDRDVDIDATVPGWAEVIEFVWNVPALYGLGSELVRQVSVNGNHN